MCISPHPSNPDLSDDILRLVNVARKQRLKCLDLQASLLPSAQCHVQALIEEANFVFFCWAGHTSRLLSQARCAECYIGTHQGCLVVETWWSCIHWPVTHITCWPAWPANPFFFQDSAKVLIKKTSSPNRSEWGTYFPMKAILDELWLCSLNQSGRVELFLIVSAGTYIWNTANKNQLWGKEKRSGYVFKLIKHCLSEYSLKWLGLCLSTGQFLSKPCQNLYSKYLIHA